MHQLNLVVTYYPTYLTTIGPNLYMQLNLVRVTYCPTYCPTPLPLHAPN